jgi:hypothetical protein
MAHLELNTAGTSGDKTHASSMEKSDCRLNAALALFSSSLHGELAIDAIASCHCEAGSIHEDHLQQELWVVGFQSDSDLTLAILLATDEQASKGILGPFPN